ncbi:hypothetical protein GCM10027605_36340 [Micromonospora zhanjiangensis]
MRFPARSGRHAVAAGRPGAGRDRMPPAKVLAGKDRGAMGHGGHDTRYGHCRVSDPGYESRFGPVPPVDDGGHRTDRGGSG